MAFEFLSRELGTGFVQISQKNLRRYSAGSIGLNEPPMKVFGDVLKVIRELDFTGDLPYILELTGIVAAREQDGGGSEIIYPRSESAGSLEEQGNGPQEEKMESGNGKKKERKRRREERGLYSRVCPSLHIVTDAGIALRVRVNMELNGGSFHFFGDESSSAAGLTVITKPDVFGALGYEGN
ncbi:predicted protein [Uncinocarpus reesii 1704]|uniref:Uncharacterized protein n=1 Tax=Uncinocarpus reesii (strain UAMH 1704) TaxID=336963 RepID=C4JN40_UNCRE|nr:uncharacterized protein UREG_04248 [Uncinocarpus reesii 1704]EEP79402.1 predicted protein [Uncinocarpus reesii 1704]